MDIEKFRISLKRRLDDTGVSQLRLAKALGIEQASLSRLLSGSASIRGESLLKLLPFVEGSWTPPPKKRSSRKARA